MPRGNGYVEESIFAAPLSGGPSLNSIWRVGNVICLDVLRALHKEPEARDALVEELRLGRGADRRLDAALEEAEGDLPPPYVIGRVGWSNRWPWPCRDRCSSAIRPARSPTPFARRGFSEMALRVRYPACEVDAGAISRVPGLRRPPSNRMLSVRGKKIEAQQESDLAAVPPWCCCTKGLARWGCGATSRGSSRTRPGCRVRLQPRGVRQIGRGPHAPTVRYMHEEAELLPESWRRRGSTTRCWSPQRRRVDRHHPRWQRRESSRAGARGAHVFTEEMGLRSIANAREVYERATCASAWRSTTAMSTQRSGAGTVPGLDPDSASGTSKSSCRASLRPSCSAGRAG